uniref:Retrovirus-related Pol polyprotein from transposon 17.6 n=1 Tax=Cajanus cajan TaxID=3821 RepID=A0A151UBQ8_CAJCA|nr:Retrovirus-related Pol polyprotein from transposon 17.6 [Cajanus cajan]
MVVKTTSAEDHAANLAEVFSQIRKHNMRLNPEKCVFGVQGGRFLGFMITNRGIEANPEKLAEKAGPIFTLLRKPKNFKWTEQCEEAFRSFKVFLSTPPILQRPDHHADLLLYLVVAEGAINAVIVQDYQTIEKLALALRYFHIASQRISSFDEFTIHHVPREQNAKADLLSKLASTKRPGQHRTIIQETLNSPSLDEKFVNTNDGGDQGWMTGIWNYLKEGTLPEDKEEARKMRVRSAKFVIVRDELFKRGISAPLLKCLAES